MVKATQRSFPAGLSAPSLRALEAAGIRSLRDLAGWRAADLAKLHGLGPKGLAVLSAAMKRQGISFRAAPKVAKR
ncbi:MAG: DNA-binding protein [Archangium sp.]|nr:DNA-binding protein [Archangium sp.]